MRILLVGNAHHNLHGDRYYNPEAKLANGFVRNGHSVYFFSPKDVARASTILRSSRIGQKSSNLAFLETVRVYKPDIIVFIHSVNITNESFGEAKRILPNVRIVQICVDPLFRVKNQSVLDRRADFVDATFITTAGEALSRYSRPHGAVAFLPNWVDAAIETGRAFERTDQLNDVFFAARVHVGEYDQDPRLIFPLALEADDGVSIAYHGINGRPSLQGAPFYENIVKCRMGLNLNADRDGDQSVPADPKLRYLYNSDRIAQLMGCGLLTISTRANQLFELFEEGREMVFADSKEELLEVVHRFQRDDAARRMIAQAGWRKSHQEFSVDLVTRYIEEVSFGKALSHAYQWPTRLW